MFHLKSLNPFSAFCQVIGMMDGAYFTGRKDILVWINQTLGLGLSKIEQTCTGAIACQLIDAHFPGNVTMVFFTSSPAFTSAVSLSI